MKKVMAYILFCAFGLSTVFNILYITNVIDKTLFWLGFTIVMLCSTSMNLSAFIGQKHENKLTEKENSIKKSNINFNKPTFFIYIVLILTWGITYYWGAVFYK